MFYGPLALYLPVHPVVSNQTISINQSPPSSRCHPVYDSISSLVQYAVYYGNFHFITLRVTCFFLLKLIFKPTSKVVVHRMFCLHTSSLRFSPSVVYIVGSMER